MSGPSTPGERLLVAWHDDCLSHDTGAGLFDAPPSRLLALAQPHPEGPTRIRNMREALREGPVAPRLDWIEGRHANDDELTRFHTPAHLAALEAADAHGSRFTNTTPMGVNSMRGIRAAAGTTLAALEAVLERRYDKAFALVRPPGHHAAPEMVDGYCFVNNVAVAVATARLRGVERIAVIDWDVHHGNGTQEGFYARDDVLTISMHMDHGSWGRNHPQTGAPDERGREAGLGYNLNLALPMGADDDTYAAVFEQFVVPAVERFAPGLVVLANGVDANQFDPNGRQLVTVAGFNRLGRLARALAHSVCEGTILVVQEGGYADAYAALCVHAVMEGLLGAGTALEDPLAFLPPQPEIRARAIERFTRAFPDLASA